MAKEILTGSKASTVVKTLNGRAILDANSIHGLSASENTITYTKGDGSTDTVTIHQDISGKANKSGDTFTGTNTMLKGFVVHSANGTSGTSGHVKICTITMNSAYRNAPIEFTIHRRNDATPTRVSLLFSNANSTETSVNSFTYIGATDAIYVYKESATVWAIYVTKTEGYDEICVTDVKIPQYMADVTLTWTNVLAASIPSGAIQATLGYGASGGGSTKLKKW